MIEKRLKNRNGKPLLADFYTLSMYYDLDDTRDRVLADTLLPVVQKKLIRAAENSWLGELRHSCNGVGARKTKRLAKLLGRHFSAQDRRKIKSLYRSNAVSFIRQIIKVRYKTVRNFADAAQEIFDRPEWYISYGGPAWSNIVESYKHLCDTNSHDHGKLFVNIDRLIDSCHNGGSSCLDKVFGENLNCWLSQKTWDTNVYWVVNQSIFRKEAKRRLKEKFNWTEELFLKGMK